MRGFAGNYLLILTISGRSENLNILRSSQVQAYINLNNFALYYSINREDKDKMKQLSIF